MIRIKDINAKLEKICINGTVDEYNEFISNITSISKHKLVSTLSQIVNTSFQYSCKNNNVDLFKYIYMTDFNSTNSIITINMIYKEFKFSLINSKKLIYEYIHSLKIKFDNKQKREIFIELCKLNYIYEIKWLCSHYDIDVHANNNSMLYHCFKHGYVDLAHWIISQKIYVCENMINICCENNNLVMLQDFSSKAEIPMTSEIIENVCKNNYYDMFVWLYENYTFTDSFCKYFSIASGRNYKKICEFLISRTDLIADLIDEDTTNRIDPNILSWLITDHIHIFDNSYLSSFMIHSDNLNCIKSLIAKYNIEIEDTYDIYGNLSTFQYFIDETIIYLVENNIEIFNKVFDNLFIECCKQNLHEQVKTISTRYVIDLDIIEDQFINACSNGDLDMAKVLYAMDTLIDICKYNNKAFYSACYNKRTATCDWLCELNDTYSYVLSDFYNIYDMVIKITIIHTDTIIDDICCVCMDNTNSKTNCNHIICLQCANKVINRICPLCRGHIKYCYQNNKRKRVDTEVDTIASIDAEVDIMVVNTSEDENIII